MTFTCPRCQMTSHHPTDSVFGYCGNCHDYTGDRPGGARWYDRQGRPIGIDEAGEQQVRYATEAEALAGHEAVCVELRVLSLAEHEADL